MWSTLVILAAIGYCIFAAPSGTPEITPFIFGGEPVTKISIYPYVASVPVNITGTVLCGGVIVAPKWVITAAHCAEALSDEREIRAGSVLWASGGQTRKIKETFVNEGWDPVLLQNDIALLKLKKPLIFNKNVKPVILPLPSSRPPAGAIAKVLGWGWTNFTGPNPDQLQVVDAPITDHAVCQQIYADINPVTDKMICTGDNTTTTGPCLGDSGGPLILNNVLQGTVSWGVTCGSPDYPLVYTAIGAYVKWIIKIILTNTP